MEIGHIIPHIEALVFASDRPLTPIDITELVNNAFGFMEDKITLEQVESALEGIVEKYNSEFYPFEMRESGGGWQFLTKKDYHKTVAQLNGEKFLKRLSTAALETLAIIAYKQPITKADIEAIRGVSSDYSIQKLLEKELIVITGRNEDMPGKPLVYATSKTFMDYFGLNSVDDLPKLKEIFNEAMVPPSLVPEEGSTLKASDDDSDGPADEDLSFPLIVSETGELIESTDNDQMQDDQDGEVVENIEIEEEDADSSQVEEVDVTADDAEYGVEDDEPGVDELGDEDIEDEDQEQDDSDDANSGKQE